MWCIVNLPNDTQQAIKLDPKSIGQECLEKVCKALDIICEMQYFGLQQWTPNEKECGAKHWINLRNRLSCDSSNGFQLMLALRVKFWVPVYFILQQSVRNLFYMQAKVDLIKGRLCARDWSNAAKLGALLCQADGICFNECFLKCQYSVNLQKENPMLKERKSLLNNDKKERDNMLSFKKRRLSKLKITENVDIHTDAIQLVKNYTESSITLDFLETDLDLEPSSLSDTTIVHSNINSALEKHCCNIECSPLKIYKNYIVYPSHDLNDNMPADFLHQIAVEHGKLSALQMSQQSAKYWLLREIQSLPGYGEEIFSGVTTNGNSMICDIAVGAHGITVNVDKEKNYIPFSAIATAKSFRRVFKLEYVDDHHDRKELEIKLEKHVLAAGLYRSITERHAFYACDTVRGVVTNQFTRDLKGTIASMFKEDTELGKRYVFDIQHTCREVHDHARRILHERNIEVPSTKFESDPFEEFVRCISNITNFIPINNFSIQESISKNDDVMCTDINVNSNYAVAPNIHMIVRDKEEWETAIERCVESRILEAMTCKICMDRVINTMFNPCCHVITCTQCASRCTNCPHCRAKILNIVKIYLPPELRINQSNNTSNKTQNIDETIKISIC